MQWVIVLVFGSEGKKIGDYCREVVGRWKSFDPKGRVSVTLDPNSFLRTVVLDAYLDFLFSLACNVWFTGVSSTKSISFYLWKLINCRAYKRCLTWAKDWRDHYATTRYINIPGCFWAGLEASWDFRLRKWYFLTISDSEASKIGCWIGHDRKSYLVSILICSLWKPIFDEGGTP
jgi:hypothetical protein